MGMLAMKEPLEKLHYYLTFKAEITCRFCRKTQTVAEFDLGEDVLEPRETAQDIIQRIKAGDDEIDLYSEIEESRNKGWLVLSNENTDKNYVVCPECMSNADADSLGVM